MSMEAIAPVRNLSIRDRAREARIIRARLMNLPTSIPATKPKLAPLTQEDIDHERHSREEAFIEAWTGDAAKPCLIARITIAQILAAASEHYEVPIIHILSKRHHAEFVRPRRIAMYLAREHTECSYPMIGARIGGRDHTTAWAGYEAIAKLVREGDQRTLDDLSCIRAVLGIVT